MGTILNDWKHLLRTETSQKFFLKIFCYNNKVTRKVKDFQNSLINKFTSPFNLQQTFQIHFMAKLLEVNHILSPDMWGKILTDLFKKCSIFSIFYKLSHFSLRLNPAIHRMRNTPNILCPRYKEQKESQPYFIFYCKLSKITLRLHQ